MRFGKWMVPLGFGVGMASSAMAEVPGEVEERFDRGEWAGVVDDLASNRSPDAVALRARALIWQGQWDEASTALERALRAHAADPDLLETYAELLLRRGRSDETAALLDPVVEGTGEVPVALRFLRASAFENMGRSSRAALEYGDLIAAYNRGDITTADDLIWVAMACHRLALYNDANFAFTRALELDPENIEVRWRWAELFLEKYRPDEALTLADEMLERNPHHPMALVLRARTAVDTSYDLEAARNWISEALAIHPDLPEALELLTELALDNRQFDEALGYLDRIDARAPERLEAMTLRAAVHMLRDEEEPLEDLQRRVLRIRPTYARFFHQLGEIGVRNFRYVDAMDWFRQALDVDGGYWPAYVSLGIGWSRLGDDERALEFLRRAFDSDPFNLQAFHMVELFEGALQQYEVVTDPVLTGVQYRFHRIERPWLEQWVPGIVANAWQRYVDGYGIVPEPPVSIEIFRDPETFGIRSVGLPHVSPHGICFGHLVTSRSPSEGDFNWQLVLEHELSHVFALNLANYRLPRWFAEGLAEYDTSLAHSHWRRDEQIALVQALAEDRLVPVAQLDSAFSSVDDIGQVVAAYYQAFMLVEYIAETYGRDRLMSMLRAFAGSRTTETAIAEVLGIPHEQLDRDFEVALRERLGDMVTLFEPRLESYRDLATWAEAAGRDPQDASLRARHGVALLMNGDVPAGAAELEAALAQSPTEPLARYTLGMLAMESGESAEAIEHFEALLSSGVRSYSASLELGRLLRQVGQPSRAREVLEQAAAMHPRGAEARLELAQVSVALGDEAGAVRWYGEVSELDENAIEAPLYLAGALDDSPEAAFEQAQRAFQIGLFEPAMAAALGRTAVATGQWALAVTALEYEIEAGATNRQESLETLARAYEGLGDQANVERVRRMLSP